MSRSPPCAPRPSGQEPANPSGAAGPRLFDHCRPQWQDVGHAGRHPRATTGSRPPVGRGGQMYQEQGDRAQGLPLPQCDPEWSRWGAGTPQSRPAPTSSTHTFLIASQVLKGLMGALLQGAPMKHRGPQVPHCLQLHWVLGSPLVWIRRSLRDAGKMPSPARLWVGGCNDGRGSVAPVVVNGPWPLSDTLAARSWGESGHQWVSRRPPPCSRGVDRGVQTEQGL